MKRFCACLLCLLLFCPSALAERPIFDIPSVVVAFYGREVKISYFRNRESPTGELVVLDEAGKPLVSSRVPYNRKQESLYFTAEESFPPGQTLRIVFRAEGKETLQQECFLALDDAERQCVRKIATAEKKIALTFDAANAPAQTAKVLEILEKYSIRCTFFIQGTFASGHPAMAARIAAAGHEIGNHSMYHIDMREATNAAIYGQIAKASEAIEAAVGRPVNLYRPPAGYTTYRDRTIAHALGCETILWTFDSMDGFADQLPQRVLRGMIAKTEPGAIILMHVYGETTLEVLNEYLPCMLEAGYEFVTVSELMQCGQKE